MENDLPQTRIPDSLAQLWSESPCSLTQTRSVLLCTFRCPLDLEEKSVHSSSLTQTVYSLCPDHNYVKWASLSLS